MALAGKIDLAFTKTYATAANADKAVAKALGDGERVASYFLVPVIAEDGTIRYGVMLCGIRTTNLGWLGSFGFNMVN